MPALLCVAMSEGYYRKAAQYPVFCSNERYFDTVTVRALMMMTQ